MKRFRGIIAATTVVALTLASACKHTPEGVLSKEAMVDLLVDVHKGEGVVDINPSSYRNDSLRNILRQAVYRRHNVTQADVDSSLSWYGHHLDQYIEIYDEVIQRLHDELEQLDADAANVVFADGDSTNVWPGANVYRLTTPLPTDNIVFRIEADDNWMAGDNYNLAFRLSNSMSSSQKASGAIFAEYADGSREYRVVGRVTDGWSTTRLVTDSTRIPTAVFGIVNFNIEPDETVYVDSVSLVRTRLNPGNYYMRGTQRRLRPRVEAPATTDETSSADE